MNVVVGICCLLLCVIGCNLLTEKYDKRQKFFNSFLAFHNKIVNEISFTQATLKAMLSKLSNENDFEKVAKDYLTSKIFKVDYKYLDNNEKDLVLNYLSVLGVGDIQTQLNAVCAFQERIKEKQVASIEDAKKFRAMHSKLGVLLGIIAFIIVL